jgi:PKD repeat protein
MSDVMKRSMTHALFFASILITAIITPVVADNYPGYIPEVSDHGPTGILSQPGPVTFEGRPGYDGSGSMYPAVFQWAVPDEVGVHPFSIGIDAQDNIYATDPVNHSIWKFSPDGSRIRKWGFAGNNSGEFYAPFGIAVNSSGYIYVTDYYRVQVFDPDGSFVTRWGSSGNNTGEFNSAIGIAVNTSGYVYVSETRTNRIQVFDPDGTFVTTWGSAGSGPGEFDSPISLAVNSSGFVHVVDQWNHRVQVFDPSGIFVRSWNRSGGGYGDGNGEFSTPQSIATDSSGYVFIGDAGNHRVQVFDPAGEYVRQFPSSPGSGISVNSSGYVHLTAPFYDRISVLDPDGNTVHWWGARGDGEGGFNLPWGIAVNTSGYSYISDSYNNQIQILSPAGAFSGQWGSEGSGDGKFLFPLGIAVNSSGFIYAVDSGNNRVQVFDPAGGYLAQWGSSGDSPGKFFDPREIAVNSSGFVYVAEAGNARIQIFTRDGIFVGSWGSQGSGPGEFNGATGIAIAANGNIFVADQANHRVQVFDPSGGFVTQFGSQGKGEGMLSYPTDVAVDSSGQVFVVDNGNNRIQVFDQNGVFQGQWGVSGTNYGQFYYPAGIATDNQGNVFVTDWFNDRIQKFSYPDSSSDALFNVTSISVHPPGDLAGGMPVSVSYHVNINGETGETFPAGSDLRMSTDLEDAMWEYTLVLDDVDSWQPVSYNQTLNVSGWILSYPPSVRESLNVTLSGTAPQVTSPATITVVNVTEINSYGNPVTGSQYSKSANVTPGYTQVGDMVIIPLCKAGTAFDSDYYPQDTPQSDPMIFGCSWNGTGQVYISGSASNVTEIYADDGYTIAIQPTGTMFETPAHMAIPQPALNLTSGMTPGTNNFTLIVRNWQGLSMSYGKFPETEWQTPYIVQVINSSGSSGLYPDFNATPLNGPAPLTVDFTDLSAAENAAITGRAWFFGDENYSAAWTEMTPAAGWPARNNFASVAMPDGTIVLMGGAATPDNYLNDTWLSPDNGATWTLVNGSSGWPARWSHNSVLTPDGTIVLIGGSTGSGATGSSGCLNDVWQSIDRGATWTLVNASTGWNPRLSLASTVLADGSIIVSGGTLPGGYTQFNDVWRSTDKGVTWSLVNAGSGWSKRYGHTMVTLPDESILLTGGYTFGSGYGNDTWRSTDSGATWTQVNASSGWTTRISHTTVVMPDGSIILTGGYKDPDILNDTWRSADNGATWTQVKADSGWPARSAHTSVAMPDGSIVLMGGYEAGYTTSIHDVWRLQPAGSSEQNPSHTYTTPGTYTVTLQVFNAGGFNSTRKTGYIAVTGPAVPAPVANFSANPASGPAPLGVSFTDLSLNDPTGWEWSFGEMNYSAPWARVNASAGWKDRFALTGVALQDGSIVIMGGMGPTAYNDTWLSADNGGTWVLMNASSGWSPRFGASSGVLPDGSIVLTGGVQNDVWRSTDKGATWSPVNLNAGWKIRGGHSMVVVPDGSLVVTGGMDGTTRPTNDVWRSGDGGVTWVRVNRSAGWEPRSDHTTVAMPDGSIVLMGGQGTGFFNDVWRSTNKGTTWILMNASATWPGRSNSAGIAMPDGSLVLIGGQAANSNTLNDTWRSTDYGATWTMVNAGADWLPREGHTGIVLPDGSIMVSGGRGVDYGYYSDVWRLYPAGSAEQNPSHTYTTPGTYTVTLRASNAGGSDSIRKAGYITVNGDSATASRIGIVRSNTSWLLDSSGNGKYGAGDYFYTFGKAGDVPITGDWDGNGRTEIGVVRSNTTWLLDASGDGKYGTGDLSYSFGKAGDIPVTGDWNGDGTTEIGVVRGGRTWLLDASGNGKFGAGDFSYSFGKAGDKPVTGDWNGDGTTEIGVVRGNTSWYLDASGNGASGAGDFSYRFGKAGDKPVTGDWSGDRTTEIGVVRGDTTWLLDTSGNGAFGAGDSAYTFGKAGDVPVTGKWA